MSVTGAAPNDDIRGEGLDDDITPVDGAFRVAFIVLQLQVVSLTAATAQCGPFAGVFGMLWFTLVLPYITVPVELLILAVPGLMTLLILRRMRRTGRRRIWRRVPFAVLAVQLVAMLVGLVFLLSGHGSDSCSFD